MTTAKNHQHEEKDHADILQEEIAVLTDVHEKLQTLAGHASVSPTDVQMLANKIDASLGKLRGMAPAKRAHAAG